MSRDHPTRLQSPGKGTKIVPKSCFHYFIGGNVFIFSNKLCVVVIFIVDPDWYLQCLPKLNC